MASKRTVEAGKAVLRVTLNDSEIAKALQNLQRRIAAFGTSMISLGKRMAAIGGAITGAFSGAAVVFAKFGDQVDKISARTGVAAEAISALGFAGEQTGTDLETIERAFFGQSRSLFDLERGLSTVKDAYGALGLSLSDLAGRAPEEQFQIIADALNEITDASRKGAIAQQIFGRSGRQVVPLLGVTRELMQEARDLGIVLDKETASSAARLTDALNRVKRQMRAVTEQIGAAVAGPLSYFLEEVTPIIRHVIEWVKVNRDLIQSLAASGAILTAFGASLAALGGLAIAITTPLGAFLASVVAVTAAVGAFVDIAGEAEHQANVFGKALADMATFLRGGEIGKAFKIFWATFAVEFYRVWDPIEKKVYQGLAIAGRAAASLGLIDESSLSGIARVLISPGGLRKSFDELQRLRAEAASLRVDEGSTGGNPFEAATREARRKFKASLDAALFGFGLQAGNTFGGGGGQTLKEALGIFDFKPESSRARTSGTFDTRFVQQIFGGKRVPEKQLEEQKKIRTATEKTAEAVAKLGSQGFGLVVET